MARQAKLCPRSKVPAPNDRTLALRDATAALSSRLTCRIADMPLRRLSAQISPEWANVRDVRMRVSRALATQSQVVRDATCMVVSELLENAVKYGGGSPEPRRVDFELDVHDGLIEVRVTSGAASEEHIARLTQRIRDVNEGERSGVLYLQRFHDLLDDPNQSGGLGIYRICVEGGFNLSVSRDGDALAVVARRRAV